VIHYLVDLIIVSILSYFIIKYKKDLEKEILRKKYFRNAAWQKLEVANRPADSGSAENFLYTNIKKEISVLIKDLEETDFKSFDGDLKFEILEALRMIDSYSRQEINDI
jgi:hypothetical protein